MNVRAYAAGLARRLGWSDDDRLTSVVTFACLGLGLWFRMRGFFWDRDAFWLDEATWAMNIFDRPLVDNLIRPPGFVVVSKLVATIFSPSETVLRALPWLAGLFAMLLSPAVGRRLFSSAAARLLLVAMVSLHPVAIDFTKEFKPYSVGFAWHFGMILLALRYTDILGRRELFWVLGVALGGTLFSQDLVMAYPGLFLVLGAYAFEKRREHLRWIAGAAAAIVVILLAQYLLIWSRMPKDTESTWGQKYDVFHTAASPEGYRKWVIGKYQDLVTMPGVRRDRWDRVSFDSGDRRQLRTTDYVIWTILHVIGLLVMLIRQRAREALLLLLPLGILLVFNRMGMWPLGAFRTNLFTLAYTAPLIAIAFDAPRMVAARWAATIPTFVLVLLPMVAFENIWHSRKRFYTYYSNFPELLERLLVLKEPDPSGQRDILLLDRRSCDPWRYYSERHEHWSALRPELDRRFTPHCLSDDAALIDDIREASDQGKVWIVLHVRRPVEYARRTGLLSDLRVRTIDAGSHTIMEIEKRR